MKKDLVGCICLTYNNIEHFANSVEQFKRQTYKNKVLIVVDNSQLNNGYSTQVLKTLLNSGLKKEEYEVLFEHKRFHLGHYRNMALHKAYELGCRYIANWDDDDVMCDNRLKMQIDSLKKNKKIVSLLHKFTIIYEPKRGVVYDFKCSLKECVMGMETTMVLDLKKEYDLPENERISYQSNLSFGEDSHFVYQFRQRYGQDKFDILHNEYDDYKYVYHGNNISGNKHFRQMIDKYKD